jgi:hypothetical protein
MMTPGRIVAARLKYGLGEHSRRFKISWIRDFFMLFSAVLSCAGKASPCAYCPPRQSCKMAKEFMVLEFGEGSRTEYPICESERTPLTDSL